MYGANFLTKEFVDYISETYRQVSGEQNTKDKLIVPMFQALGYDINCYDEVRTEIAGRRGDKREKVDYVLCIAGKPKIIVEAKDWRVNLGTVHINQLFRYFGASECKVAVLTNGIHYWFYSDFKQENVMDELPFHRMNVLAPTAEDERFLTSICKVQQCSYDVNKLIIEKKVEQMLENRERVAQLLTSLYFKSEDYDAVFNGVCKVI